MIDDVAPDRTSGHLWLRDNLNLILLAANALIVVFLGYTVVSWTVFEIRMTSLLALAERAQDQIRQEKSSEKRRPVTAGTAGWRFSLLPGASAQRAQEGTTVLSAAGEQAASGMLSPAGAQAAAPETKADSDPREKGRKEVVAKLERRRLFGEPPPAIHVPRIEAILGDSALIDGQWLARGGKTGDFTLVGIETNSVAMEDDEGNDRSFPLLFGSGGLASARMFTMTGGPSFGGDGKGYRGKGKAKNAKNQKGAYPNAANKQKGKNNKNWKSDAPSAKPSDFQSGGPKVPKESQPSRDRPIGSGGKGKRSNSKLPGEFR
jgi:hypothetical protein